MIGRVTLTPGAFGGARSCLRPVDEAVFIGDLDHGSVGPTERTSPHSGPAGDGVQVGGQVEILGLERSEGEDLMHRWQQLQPAPDLRDGAWNPSRHTLPHGSRPP
jgi:hypothetical protein